jgi:hypothetical protein
VGFIVERLFEAGEESFIESTLGQTHGADRYYFKHKLRG